MSSVEGDGEDVFPAEVSHFVPVVGRHGLFDGMEVILGQFPKFLPNHVHVRAKPSVGIHAQFKRAACEAGADGFEEPHLVLPVDGSYLGLDAPGARRDVLLGRRAHLPGGVHPHEAVGGNAHLGMGKGRVVENRILLEIKERRLQRKKQGWIGAQEIGIVLCGKGFLHQLRHATQGGVGIAVAAQVGQGRTLTQADA